MPVETRYFKNATATVNGLAAYALALDLTGTLNSVAATVVGIYFAGDMGIRVWKRSAAGVETEITPGAPVAVVQYLDGDFRLLKSNTWNCPQTVLANTDSIVVRVYYRIPSGTGTWRLFTTGVFTTEQLGTQRLDAATWTVYYYGSLTANVALNRTGIEFIWDGAYPSRIENFTWTPPAPPVAKRIIGDGFMWIVC